ncbi:MAG TPA: hypothetical protein VEC06_21280 [Paucimonas sp.]|nr:hypothetical protein [Paucimonas sp.]
MSDIEILALLAQCKNKSSMPWDVLVDQFARQLIALSDRLSRDELYALLDIALVCYQKGFDEFAAHREAQSFINELRTRAGMRRTEL